MNSLAALGAPRTGFTEQGRALFVRWQTHHNHSAREALADQFSQTLKLEPAQRCVTTMSLDLPPPSRAGSDSVPRRSLAQVLRLACGETAITEAATR